MNTLISYLWTHFLFVPKTNIYQTLLTPYQLNQHGEENPDR